MFGRKFMNFGWCKDKYAIFDGRACSNCGYYRIKNYEAYCGYDDTALSSSGVCQRWIPNG